MSTKITANVFRTDSKQVAELGRNAFTNMHFNNAGEASVRQYCERLAQGDGIINPEITLTITES